jgi:hypothetical protein
VWEGVPGHVRHFIFKKNCLQSLRDRDRAAQGPTPPQAWRGRGGEGEEKGRRRGGEGEEKGGTALRPFRLVASKSVSALRQLALAGRSHGVRPFRLWASDSLNSLMSPCDAPGCRRLLHSHLVRPSIVTHFGKKLLENREKMSFRLFRLSARNTSQLHTSYS